MPDGGFFPFARDSPCPSGCGFGFVTLLPDFFRKDFPPVLEVSFAGIDSFAILVRHPHDKMAVGIAAVGVQDKGIFVLIEDFPCK